MKAIVLHGNKDLRLDDIPKPTVSSGEVCVRVRASGLCHTDFNEYVNGPLYVSVQPHQRTRRCIPLTLGHEFSGEIVEVAPDTATFRIGDRVAVSAVDCCRACVFCLRGLYVHCPLAATIGFGRDGGYADYAVVPASCCHLLPAEVEFQDGALVEPLSVAMHSMRRAGVQMGCRAAVIGGGTIGLCTLQALRCCGAQDVYVIERSAEKRPFAELFGARGFILASNGNIRREVLDKTDGLGVDVAFECVGSSAALHTALSVTRPGGTVCLTGVIPKSMEVYWSDILSKEKTITTTNAYFDEFPIVIAMLADGRLRAKPLVTRRVSIGEAAYCLMNFEKNGSSNIKTIIESEG